MTREQRFAARRADPMGDEAAESALRFMVDNAEAAGKAKADVIYMESFRKVKLNQLKLASGLKSDAAQDTWARAHPEYLAILDGQREAIEKHETLYWKRIAAEATIEAWRTKNANHRGAHLMK